MILMAFFALLILGMASKKPIMEKARLGIRGFPKRSSKIPNNSQFSKAFNRGSKCKFADGSRAETNNFKTAPFQIVQTKLKVYPKSLYKNLLKI